MVPFHSRCAMIPAWTTPLENFTLPCTNRGFRRLAGPLTARKVSDWLVYCHLEAGLRIPQSKEISLILGRNRLSSYGRSRFHSPAETGAAGSLIREGFFPGSVYIYSLSCFFFFHICKKMLTSAITFQHKDDIFMFSAMANITTSNFCSHMPKFSSSLPCLWMIFLCFYL